MPTAACTHNKARSSPDATAYMSQQACSWVATAKQKNKKKNNNNNVTKYLIGHFCPCDATKNCEQPATQRILASSVTLHIWHVCCLSNKTGAPTAHPPNSAQLGDTSYHSPKLHLGMRSSVGMWQGKDTHTNGAIVIYRTWLCQMRCICLSVL